MSKSPSSFILGGFSARCSALATGLTQGIKNHKFENIGGKKISKKIIIARTFTDSGCTIELSCLQGQWECKLPPLLPHCSRHTLAIMGLAKLHAWPLCWRDAMRRITLALALWLWRAACRARAGKVLALTLPSRLMIKDSAAWCRGSARGRLSEQFIYWLEFDWQQITSAHGARKPGIAGELTTSAHGARKPGIAGELIPAGC